MLGVDRKLAPRLGEWLLLTMQGRFPCELGFWCLGLGLRVLVFWFRVYGSGVGVYLPNTPPRCHSHQKSIMSRDERDDPLLHGLELRNHTPKGSST